jgi:hypothetical protein
MLSEVKTLLCSLACLSSTLAFTICFSSFLLLFVNWHSLLFCDSSCDDVVGFRSDVFSHPSTLEYLVFTYFAVFCVYWLWNLLSFFYTLRDAIEMRAFYKDDLDIEDVSDRQRNSERAFALSSSRSLVRLIVRSCMIG